MISFKDLGNMGRLGNQLFQIATTIALAIRNNDSYAFPNWPYESSFNLHGCFFNISNTETFRELSFAYAPIQYKPNLNLYGFFQSEKYFKDYQDIIQNLLTPNIGFNINYDVASIHVRRGDYLKISNAYAKLDMNYYQKAMKMIGAKKYMIFSDDIAWCKANFTDNNVIFSDGKSDVEDLALMLSCEHNIIANSSFSWWGAYLNKNPSKIVIAPQNWFGTALPHDTKDLLPNEWNRI